MKKIIWIICVVLAALPFIWFGSGVVNLGGDSSRLYFFQPLSFFEQFALYNVIPSESGFEHVPYYFIPFTLFLAAIKSIVRTPHLLIVVFYSTMLVVSFLSVTHIIRELLKEGDNQKNEKWKILAAVLGGLFYTLSPIIGPNWDKNLISHNQIFLNPLIFFLTLKFIKTGSLSYGYALILLTFLFAPGFSFSSAPPFFAFYPIAVLFFTLYILVSKSKVSAKKISLVIVLLVLVHFFHIFPQISNLFDTSSSYNTRVFSDKSAYEGQVYFDSVRVVVRLSKNIIPLIQTMQPLFTYDWILFLFPLVIILGVLYNARRTVGQALRQNYILLLVFFLITLFLASANITPLISSIYRFMFRIPGFSMFRNYYGQFMYVHYFYYSLVLGFAFYYVLYFSTRRVRKALILMGSSILIVSSWSFISGKDVNQPFYQGKENVDGTFKMDAEYEKVLDFFKHVKGDGKVLVLPLTDFGYQVLAGQGGYYIGPSTIGYLTGRNDFAGYAGFTPFDEDLLIAAKAKDYERFSKILSVFNIKYIFHNTDESVYSKEYFEGFPYQTVREFLPDSQETYTELLSNLNATLIQSIGDKYKIYEVNPKNYLPRIYATSGMTFLNDKTILLPPAELNNLEKPAFFFSENMNGLASNPFNSFILGLSSSSDYKLFADKRRPSIYPTPHVAHYFSSPLYRFVLQKEHDEQKELLKTKKFDDYFDFSVQVAVKRIIELQNWGSSISLSENVQSIDVLDQTWEEPKRWEVLNFSGYTNWETSLVQYKRVIDDLIANTETTHDSIYPVEVNKLSLTNEIQKHQQRFVNTILSTSSLTRNQKIYLYNLSNTMFNDLYTRLQVADPVDKKVEYTLDPGIIGESETYQVYIEKAPLGNFDLSDINLQYKGMNLLPNAIQSQEDWIRYEDISVDGTSKTLLNLELLKEMNLNNSRDTWKQLENIESGNGHTSIALEKPEINVAGGVVKEISDWNPGSYYKLSFEYNTHNEPFRIRLIEQSEELGKSVYTVVLDDVLRASDWSTYARVLLPSKNTRTRLLQIAKDTDQASSEEVIQTEKKTGKVDFRKLSILQVPHPQIILVRNNEADIQTPKITYNRINPSKYRIHIEDASSAYALVFSDAFSPNWKLYPSDSVGQFEETQADTNTNSFFDKNMFETMRLATIGEKNHFQMNGYSNGWFIDPSMVGNKTEYDLILEMSTQRRFYIGSLVTLVGLLVLVTLTITSLIHRTTSSK